MFLAGRESKQAATFSEERCESAAIRRPVLVDDLAVGPEPHADLGTGMPIADEHGRALERGCQECRRGMAMMVIQPHPWQRGWNGRAFFRGDVGCDTVWSQVRQFQHDADGLFGQLAGPDSGPANPGQALLFAEGLEPPADSHGRRRVACGPTDSDHDGRRALRAAPTLF